VVSGLVSERARQAWGERSIPHGANTPGHMAGILPRTNALVNPRPLIIQLSRQKTSDCWPKPDGISPDHRQLRRCSRAKRTVGILVAFFAQESPHSTSAGALITHVPALNVVWDGRGMTLLTVWQFYGSVPGLCA